MENTLGSNDPNGVFLIEEGTMPKKFTLLQNYPNPFNPTTTIAYTISQQSHVLLTIYDLLGREAAVLVNERKEAGRYSMQWDASAVPSGIYFYRLEAGAFSTAKKLIVLK
jgi:hypothetical protein